MRELNIESRRNICKICPIYSPSRDVCSSSLWLNPETNDVSTYRKSGYIRGCGCHISLKTRNPNSRCIAGKW